MYYSLPPAFRRRCIASAIALLCAGISPAALAEGEPADGDDKPAEAQMHIMQDVVVSATRVEQDVNDVAATITSITAQDIERQMPTDIKDLLRYEPGVSVRSTPNRASAVFYQTGRGGNEGINIRGLEGDQVLLQTDGVRLPMMYDSGPFAAGRGDYLEMEAYKRAEILRGPASTQYGSDGLSGAVSFLTKDPQDLLTLGKPWQAALKTTYSSADNSWNTVPSFAYADEIIEAMLLVSRRVGRETENMGSNDEHSFRRTEPNPADVRSRYLLSKIVLKPGAHHQIKLTVEDMNRKINSDVRSFFGDAFTVPTLTNVEADTVITRRLYKLDYAFDNPDQRWFQRLNASFYHQDSNNEQFGLEERSTNPRLRTRTTNYQEETAGGSVQMESNFGDTLTHRLIYGMDTALSDVTSFKNGFNSSGTPFVPNKSFPDTDYDLFGAFIQDEIGFGQFSLIPALRYDRFELTPHADSYYQVQNATTPTKLKDHEISPKLGLIWKMDPLANFFAQYAHGFRAPKPSQVNGGVTNLTAASPYTSIGNPSLKPEVSDSIEFGVRGQSARLNYSASIFRSKYKDFIASNQYVSGSGTPLDPTVYQSINLSSVDIDGYELRAGWAFNDNWRLNASYAHAKGDSREDGIKTPLYSVDPDKLVAGLHYDKEGRYGAELMVTAVERKKRNPDPSSYYNTAGFTLVDLTGYYQFNRNFSVNGGVFNIFDRKYLLWSDVRDLSPTYAQVDAYTQPGRNAAISFKYQF